MMNKKKICFIVAIPGTATSFLKDHFKKLSTVYDIYLVCNISDESQIADLEINGFKSICIERGINIIADFKALLELRKYFKESNFHSIHSITPKAGLLTAFAGYLAKVPNRIHIFTGQVWATKKGIFRKILMAMDWLVSHLNTQILVDGESQRQFLIQHRIIKEKKSYVIGHGSISGVNIERFKPDSIVRKSIRDSINITDKQIVFIFLGRFNRDKGILELYEAFNKLAQVKNNAFLLLVGVDEENLISKIDNYPNIKSGENFHFFGRTKNPEVVLRAGDVFCLPTYREGFGTSVIEASCLGLPVICSDTYGVMDAMVDDVTGLRCKTGDSISLYEQMKKLADDPGLRSVLGTAGRERVLQQFSGESISDAWLQFYNTLNERS